ncbi:MAG: carboxypeptidase regulatory-like domain-containing protein [Pyrinomonadaceae bacterium]
MHRPRLTLSLAALALVMLAPGVARACECAGSSNPRPCSTFWGTPVLFTGLVTDFSAITPPAPPEGERRGQYQIPQRVARFNVEEPFRGVAGATVEVTTGAGGGDCGYNFRVGARYIVYAYAGEGGKLSTGICTATKPLERAGAELEFARSLAHASPGATIYGSVVFSSRDLAAGKYTREPLVGTKVTVESEGGDLRREVETDAEGKYEVTGLPAGSYSVRVATPKHLGNGPPGEPFRIEEKQCRESDFWLTWMGEVAGRVTDEKDAPVPNVSLRLAPSVLDNKELASTDKILYASTDEDGRYKFQWVPPGQYVIVINPEGTPGVFEPPYPRTFYPGVEERAQAGVVSVGEGEQKGGYDLHLPRRLVEREVTGVVVWPDGRPAKGAMALLQSGDRALRQVGFPVAADEQGRFTLKGYEGATFVVTATVTLENARQMCGGPAEVAISNGVEIAPIKLVIDTPYGNCNATFAKRQPKP